jgi:hypothetical protein
MSEWEQRPPTHWPRIAKRPYANRFNLVVHFTTLIIYQTIRGRKVRWLVSNGLGVGRRLWYINRDIIPTFAWYIWGNPVKSSVVVTCVTAEIRTEGLLNKSLELLVESPHAHPIYGCYSSAQLKKEQSMRRVPEESEGERSASSHWIPSLWRLRNWNWRRRKRNKSECWLENCIGRGGRNQDRDVKIVRYNNLQKLSIAQQFREFSLSLPPDFNQS